VDEMAVANAHSLGARPFERENYIEKFNTLTKDIIAPEEAERFLKAVQDLPNLGAGVLDVLNVQVPTHDLSCNTRDTRGIF